MRKHCLGSILEDVVARILYHELSHIGIANLRFRSCCILDNIIEIVDGIMNKLKLFIENFLVYGLGGIISKIILKKVTIRIFNGGIIKWKKYIKKLLKYEHLKRLY